jgi:glycosyltransferase involved in cell wall biosynthesis
VTGNNHSVISVVMGSYNRREFLRSAVESVRRNGITVPYEIIVVDGGSSDGSVEWLARQTDIITILQHNRTNSDGRGGQKRSWGYFMNLGFKCAEGAYVVMISDDSLLIPGAVMNGLSQCQTLQTQGRQVGAVAFYWRNWPEQREYWVGLTLGRKMFVNHGLYVRSALERVGWIDQDRFRFYYADGDLSLKLWHHGYEVVDSPSSFVEHFAHANEQIRERNLSGERADWNAYIQKWSGVFYDPDNPEVGTWLTRDHEDVHRTTQAFPAIRGSKRMLTAAASIMKRPAAWLTKW